MLPIYRVLRELLWSNKQSNRDAKINVAHAECSRRYSHDLMGNVQCFLNSPNGYRRDLMNQKTVAHRCHYGEGGAFVELLVPESSQRLIG